jgi:hypothetical protein
VVSMRNSLWVCWYYLNCVREDKIGVCTRAAIWDLVKDRGGEQWRRDKHPSMNPVRGPEGWHFSYMGDIPRKLGAFAHQELNRHPFNSPAHIAHCKSHQQDIFGKEARHGPMRIEENLSFLPQYVQDNPEKFRTLLYDSHAS